MKEEKIMVRYSKAVSVAADLFLEKSIDEVKMTDIADGAGIGVASLYRFFETKTKIAIQAGALLWNCINDEFNEYLERDRSRTGLKQIVYCLGFYKILFSEHKPFLKFLDDFDRLMLTEKVPSEVLEDYEKSIVNFYAPLSESFEKGVLDGSIKKGIDFNLVYLSMTHALISVSQKFIRGEILPHDDFSLAEKEINQLIEMTVQYMKK